MQRAQGWVGLKRGGMENGLQLVRVNREDRRQERRELGVERRWQFRSLPEGRKCSTAGRAAAGGRGPRPVKKLVRGRICLDVARVGRRARGASQTCEPRAPGRRA